MEVGECGSNLNIIIHSDIGRIAPGPMINTQLVQKYDQKFNFFFAKPISEIVYNRATAPATLDYKDVAVLSEANEYLKRTYHIKNSAGRNEIYDRIRMLADFYCGAAMLKYEHPMMVLTQTKDIFLKRIKRMKKMIASDCSSQQSSQQRSQHSSQIQSFSSSRFLRTIESSELDQSSSLDRDSLIKNCKKKEKSYDSELHDIFGTTLDFGEMNAFTKIKSSQFRKSRVEPYQQGLEHLIVDIDDLDRQKIVKEYTKMQQRDNPNKKQGMLKKSSIIITPLDHYPPADKESQSSEAHNYYPKSTKNMKKQPLHDRYKQQYDETIRVNNYNMNMVSSTNYNSRNFRQPNTGTRSPSFGINHPLEGNSTERNFMRSSNYAGQGIRYEQQLGDENRKFTRDRIYTQNQNPSTKVYQSSNQLLIPSQQNQTLYLTQENSVSSKIHKKQYIRDKAVALLQKVKSEQKLPIYYEEVPRNTLKYPARNRPRYE